jgi:hypothetical protein
MIPFGFELTRSQSPPIFCRNSLFQNGEWQLAGSCAGSSSAVIVDQEIGNSGVWGRGFNCLIKKIMPTQPIDDEAQSNARKSIPRQDWWSLIHRSLD